MKPADLNRLAKLKKRLAHEDVAERAGQAAAPARDSPADECFGDAVVGVAPLARGSPASPPRPRVEPPPRRRLRDEAQVLAASLSDEIDISTLLDADAALSFRRPGIGPDVPARLRRGQWAIQRELDLHGLRRDAARESLSAFIGQAARDGLRCVRVVHGKGHGSPGREPVLKDLVSRWLVQKNEVSAFTRASAADGGQGALLVLLTRR
jgi:DNA-nicking Smr family endonuclease